uniref:Reverse transcriptase domain-containing protein n=1 Tax=Fagus sylvatica TaxID=28930 RepID=A0A2N9HQ79_FAGSY
MLYCISTVRFSILVNGTPSGFLDTSRGIRQGDPLSPLLFVVVMEAFSKLMQKAEEEKYIRGFEIRGRNQEPMQITHLCYADDTILFCEPVLEQVGYVKCTLLCFEAASGLKVNLSKSEMVQIGQVSNLTNLVALLECKISTVPMKYLGMPLGARFKSKLIWDPILEKLGRKLAGWKHLYLSKGGKWLWRFATEKDSYWRKVVALKYGVNPGNWVSGLGQGPYGISLWKYIRKGWAKFCVHTSFEVGNGACTRFWEDQWCGDQSLSAMFPSVRLVRHLHDWEKTPFQTFMGFVYLQQVHRDKEDQIRWSPDHNGKSAVKSYYKVLSGSPAQSFPWKPIWKSKVPPRVAFFVWIAAKGKI